MSITLDIAHIEKEYSGNGGKVAYHPRLLLSLIFYGYATGVFSSRKIERATYDSVPFRYIAVNSHPDHDTISNFRKRFLEHLELLFTQILVIANDLGCLQPGTVSLDGTKIHANASKHSAYSYAYASALEERLQQEVAELLRLAGEADNEPLPDGLDIPKELLRRDERIEAIRKAKAEMERRAAEHYAKELDEYRIKQEARQTKEEATGRKAETAGRAYSEGRGSGQSDGRGIPHHAGFRRRIRAVLQRTGGSRRGITDHRAI